MKRRRIKRSGAEQSHRSQKRMGERVRAISLAIESDYGHTNDVHFIRLLDVLVHISVCIQCTRTHTLFQIQSHAHNSLSEYVFLSLMLTYC